MTATRALTPVTAAAIQAARIRIKPTVVRTPLVRLNADTGAREVFLKLENLQPIGSFKLRGAANAMAIAGKDALANGVYTASAGNMAQGVAWCAREFGVRCQVVVPAHAPKTNTDAIERLGGEVIKVPFDEWWQTIVNHGRDGMPGLFVHPFADVNVMAGNGTIAAEVFDDIDHVDAILVPYGGGGLVCGIAAAARALSPNTKVYAVEVETAAPLTASWAAGVRTPVIRQPSFIDGMGSGGVAEEMWPLAQELLAGTIVVTVAQVADAVRLLMDRANVVAEGAGAAAVAAAIHGNLSEKRIVSIVSGGNIDLEKLATIIHGDIPVIG
ncbi:MAG: pyridoxal-phosphate dependent enzyme [Gemmatimonadaceae bacterium]